MQTYKPAKQITMAAALYFSRKLCVTACLLALFALPWTARAALISIGPLTAITNITFNGQNVSIDSFDSSDTNHSNWQTTTTYRGTNYYGIYPYTNAMSDVSAYDSAEPYRRKDNSVVATDGALITVQNANIAGYVDTGPGGISSISSGGVVGDVAWTFVSPRSGLEAGHVRDDMNVTFPDVQLPANAWTEIDAKKHIGSNPTTNYWITASGYYAITNNINGKNNNTTSPVSLDIDIAATNVVLYLPTGIKYSTGNTLTVEQNCDLTLYVGNSVTFSGQGSVNNMGDYAPAFTVFGLPTCTSINLGGAMSLAAFVYAPEASLNAGGGGSMTYDAVGSFLVHDITFGGHMNFHFDESLASKTSLPLAIITQPTNQIVQAGSNVTFSVSTGGGSPMKFRWFFNQTNLIATLTNSSLSLTNVHLTNTGNYSVVVTNLFNAVTSSAASLVVYTNATPVLSVPGSPANGQFQFSITGVAGLNYAVQASTNLADWIPLATNVSPFFFTETNAGGYPQRFYRSIYLP
jgi:hypothetical protein